MKMGRRGDTEKRRLADTVITIPPCIHVPLSPRLFLPRTLTWIEVLTQSVADEIKSKDG